MKIAVVIPTVGRSLFVLNMALALQAGSRQADEIIIVDQTEPDLRNPWAMAQLRGLEAHGACRIVEQRIKSATVARNRGALEATAELLVFVDDDAFVPPDFLAHYDALFADPTLDAATGMELVGEADRGTIDTSRIHVSRPDGHTILHGSNFAIRRKVMFELGGLDENFVGAAHHEDSDLAWRLHEQRRNVVWSADPWVYHLCYPAGGGRVSNPRAHEDAAHNLCYFRMRHGKLDVLHVLHLLRQLVLNRRNFLRPWTLPARCADFVRGYRRAKQSIARGPTLPLAANN